jgi:hypothetical protein
MPVAMTDTYLDALGNPIEEGASTTYFDGRKGVVTMIQPYDIDHDDNAGGPRMRGPWLIVHFDEGENGGERFEATERCDPLATDTDYYTFKFEEFEMAFKYEGTVSEGTMIPEDLVRKFREVLLDLDRDTCMRLDGEHHYEDSRTPEDEGYHLDDLFDALNDHAPEGYYFGPHPGDGADYGFWRSED